MIVNEKNSMPYMKSLASCLNHIIKEGYSEEFTVTEQGLEAIHQQHYYHPDQIQVVNFYRFEGESDPADNAILYVIETADGVKGTLVDAYGTYNDARITRFMTDVKTKTKSLNN